MIPLASSLNNCSHLLSAPLMAFASLEQVRDALLGKQPQHMTDQDQVPIPLGGTHVAQWLASRSWQCSKECGAWFESRQRWIFFQCLQLANQNDRTSRSKINYQQPISCFTQGIMWQAHQLVLTGDDSLSSKSPEKLVTEKLKESTNPLPESCQVFLSKQLLNLLACKNKNLRDQNLKQSFAAHKEQGAGVP